MKKLCMILPMALILCLMVGCQDKADKALGTILIEFGLSPFIIENLKGDFIGELKWDPCEQIIASLETAGYKVTSKKKKPHNLALKITYREGLEYVARQSIHWIKEISFILEDSTGAILLKEKRNPILGRDSPEEAIKSFADDLPNFINERLGAEDEFSFVNGLLQREGFNTNRFRRLLQLQDPRTAEVLVPHLTTCSAQSRWDVRWALEDLGFEPRTAWEKAAFDMVTLDSPHHYSSDFKFQKSSAAKLIAKHGITAIELFLEDLKCGGVWITTYGAGPKISGYARYALGELTKQKWRYWKSSYGSFDPRWNEFTVTRLTDALEAAREDPTNLAAMDEMYIERMIEVLGDIADYPATELVQAYASHPQWAKVANEAVKNIARRSGKLTSIDMYYNKRQVEMEYEVMEHSIRRGPFLVSDKQIIEKLKETAKQKGADAVIIRGVVTSHIYTEETGKKERIIEVTFIKYKLLN